MTMNVFNQRGGMAVALLLIAVLSACGGGKQVKKFQPSNIVSFGDESSAFVPAFTLETGTGTIKGLKYTVNDLEVGIPRSLIDNTPLLSTDAIDLAQWNDDAGFPFLTATAVGSPVADVGTSVVKRVFSLPVIYTPAAGSPITATKNVAFEYFYNCGQTSLSESNRLWIQILASSYGMSYDQSCPLDTRGRAESFAAAGAKVADVVTQISTNTAKINANTLVTVMAGQNDILAQYDALYPGSSIPTDGAISLAVAALQSSGRQLGQAVNGIANKGARTLIMTVPDLSYSPRIGADTAKKAVMDRLVRAFNEAIFSSGGVRTDGHLIGVVKGFDLIREMAQNRGAYGLVDATLAACHTSKLRSIDTTQLIPVTSPVSSGDLKYCNDATLVTGATAYTYLWAYDTWLGPRGHEILAGSAFARADNDTF